MTAKEAIETINELIGIADTAMREANNDGAEWDGDAITKEAESALAHLTKLAEENERLRPILDERDRQDKKWGVQNHGPMTWLAILSEEVGEASKAVLEGNAEGYKKELTQVAAVVVAMLECFKRGDASLVSVTEIQRENATLKAAEDALREALRNCCAMGKEQKARAEKAEAELERLRPWDEKEEES